MKPFVTVLLISSLFIAVNNAQTWPLTVTIPSIGTLKGVINTDTSTPVNTFLGVPFARSPAGALRWKAPVPVTQYDSDPFLANRFGPNCPQGHSPNQTEDCLSLNIFAPNTPGTKSVLFWIYGGGYVGGGSSYYPSSLLASRGEIVVVTINYRLGALGFLSHPLLYAETKNTSTGNYGLLDQRLALQWVVDNIHLFGGKNNDITIAGESAGACSVIYHLLYNILHPQEKTSLAVTKFLSESTGAYAQAWSLNTSFHVGIESQHILKCSNLECMRSAPLSALLSLPNISNIAFPTIDGSFMNDWPYSTIRSTPLSVFKRYKYMLGTNLHEGNAFVYPAFKQPVPASEYDKVLENFSQIVIGGADVDFEMVRDVYPCVGSNEDCRKQLGDVYGDYLFICPTSSIAEKVQADWVYLFSQGGAEHGSELQYVFGMLDDHRTKEEKELSLNMQYYWGGFVKNGDPNSFEKTKVRWPVFVGRNWNDQHVQYQRIDLNATRIGEVINYRTTSGHYCGYWERIFQKMYPPMH